MKPILLIFSVIIMGAGVFFYTESNDEIKIIEKNNVENNASLFDLIKGNSYIINFDLNVNNEPLINGADFPEFSLSAGTEIILIDQENDFAKIKYQEKEGWIPAWYISKISSSIRQESPFIVVLNTSTNVYLYPNETPKYDFKLEKGKVVKVIASYFDWYCIEYIRYDCPEYDLTWIKNDNTLDYNERLVKEGIVSDNTNIYSEEGNLVEDTISGYIFIVEEKGDFYKVFGAGGQEGFIKKKDFIPIKSVNDL